MPFIISYQPDGGLVARGEGIVTGDELLALNETLYASPENIRKIVYQIVDLTDVSDVVISNSVLRQVADQDKRAAEINPGMFIIVVTDEDLYYGLSRMWDAYSYESPLTTMVFRKRADAELWIREQLEKKP